jgi:hypothetical protein
MRPHVNHLPYSGGGGERSRLRGRAPAWAAHGNEGPRLGARVARRLPRENESLQLVVYTSGGCRTDKARAAGRRVRVKAVQTESQARALTRPLSASTAITATPTASGSWMCRAPSMACAAAV